MPLSSYQSVSRHSFDRIVPYHSTPSPKTMPHSKSHNFLLTLLIEVIFSILELDRHKLRVAFNPILVTLCIHGWKALIHTSLTWASYQWCYKFHVSLQCRPCAHSVVGIPQGDVCDMKITSLNSTLSKEIFMDQPLGFEVLSGQVCCLKKSLYGLKQASQC